MNEKSLPQGQLGPCTTRARSTTYFRWHHNTKKTLRNKTQLQSFGWVRLPGFGSLVYLLKILPSAKVMSLFTIYYCACGGVFGGGGVVDRMLSAHWGVPERSSVFNVFKSTSFFSLRPRPAWLVRIQKAFSWHSPPSLLLEIDPRFCRWGIQVGHRWVTTETPIAGSSGALKSEVLSLLPNEAWGPRIFGGAGSPDWVPHLGTPCGHCTQAQPGQF